MIRTLIALSVLVSASALGAAPGWQEAFLSQRLLSVVTWQTADGDLLCGIQERGAGEAGSAVLLCFTKSSGGAKQVASATLDPGVIETRALQITGSPLLITRGSGSGLIVQAYVYASGHVKKVWEDGSFVPAETFFADNEANMMVIALGDPEWVTGNDGTRQKVIGTSRIFAWTGTGFEPLGQVRWENRFSAAASAVSQRRSSKQGR